MDLKVTISGPVEGKKGFFHAKGKSPAGGTASVVVWEKPDNKFVITPLKEHASFIDAKRVVSYAGGILTKATNTKAGQVLKFENLSYTLRRDKKKEKEETKVQIAEQQAQIQQLLSLVSEQSDTINSLMETKEETDKSEMELLKQQLAAQQEEINQLKSNDSKAETVDKGSEKKAAQTASK